MNLYEVMFIQNPDIGEEDQEKLLTRFKSTISKYGGEVINLQDQGIRTLAFKIQKRSRGRYFLVHFEGPGSMILELERFMRLDENIVRFVVIKLDRHVTREELMPKVAVEAAAEAEAEAETPAEPAAENVAETKAEEVGE